MELPSAFAAMRRVVRPQASREEDSQSGRTFRWVSLSAAMLVLLSGAVSVNSALTQAEAAGWVAHTHEVIAQGEALRAALSMAESAERAYLLTGDDRVLVNYSAAQRSTAQNLDELERLTQDNMTQQRQIPLLRQSVQDRFGDFEHAIDSKRRGDMAAAVEVVASRGLDRTQMMQRQLESIRRVEDELLVERLARARRASVLDVCAAFGSAALGLAALAALYSASVQHAARLSSEQRALRQSREETSVQAQALQGANEQLRASQSLLEHRVRQRTSALGEANAELEGFARTIAHDLRAPLRNIQGYATAILEDEAERLSPDGVEFADRLVASARRLDAMVTDLLAYSSVARSELRLAPVDLRVAVAQVLQDLRGDIKASGATIDVMHDLPTVVAHGPTLTSVIANLVANGIKFVAPGTQPQLKLGAERNGIWVDFSVTDNGIGILPEHQDRIFEVFERLHGQESYPGTGIGLAIVRKSVERMGGSVKLQSEPLKGSEFVVRLRAADAVEAHG